MQDLLPVSVVSKRNLSNRKKERNCKMKKLQFRIHNSLPIHRLPFVKKKKNGICFWNVPKKGKYSGGFKTGKALALIYLKFLRENRQNIISLQHIVLDMFDLEYRQGASSKESSLRGQIVGFFSELDWFLSASSRKIGSHLDGLDYMELLEDANNGLKYKKR